MQIAFERIVPIRSHPNFFLNKNVTRKTLRVMPQNLVGNKLVINLLVLADVAFAFEIICASSYTRFQSLVCALSTAVSFSFLIQKRDARNGRLIVCYWQGNRFYFCIKFEGARQPNTMRVLYTNGPHCDLEHVLSSLFELIVVADFFFFGFDHRGI